MGYRVKGEGANRGMGRKGKGSRRGRFNDTSGSLLSRNLTQLSFSSAFTPSIPGETRSLRAKDDKLLQRKRVRFARGREKFRVLSPKGKKYFLADRIRPGNFSSTLRVNSGDVCTRVNRGVFLG